MNYPIIKDSKSKEKGKKQKIKIITYSFTHDTQHRKEKAKKSGVRRRTVAENICSDRVVLRFALV